MGRQRRLQVGKAVGKAAVAQSVPWAAVAAEPHSWARPAGSRASRRAAQQRAAQQRAAQRRAAQQQRRQDRPAGRVVWPSPLFWVQAAAARAAASSVAPASCRPTALPMVHRRRARRASATSPRGASDVVAPMSQSRRAAAGRGRARCASPARGRQAVRSAATVTARAPRSRGGSRGTHSARIQAGSARRICSRRETSRRTTRAPTGRKYRTRPSPAHPDRHTRRFSRRQHSIDPRSPQARSARTTRHRSSTSAP